MAEWYYIAGGQKNGPVSHEEILRLADEGTVNAKTPVKHGEGDEWEVPETVDELHEFLAWQEEADTLDTEISQEISAHLAARQEKKERTRFIDFMIFLCVAEYYAMQFGETLRDKIVIAFIAPVLMAVIVATFILVVFVPLYLVYRVTLLLISRNKSVKCGSEELDRRIREFISGHKLLSFFMLNIFAGALGWIIFRPRDIQLPVPDALAFLVSAVIFADIAIAIYLFSPYMMVASAINFILDHLPRGKK